uniref:N-acetylmannosaminyltransferase n=1 Tax=uncultured Armatimonadetes bacterium TaxID=157466 RepID=A0A6J4H6U5_9BACT|nr:N-acetylmannosaminyltransferase [uncultured Armatimonadetes bacterium]
MDNQTLDSVNLFGMRVDRVDMAGALALIERFVQERTPPRHIVTADASMVVTADNDPDFAAIVNASDLVTPDGAGILWATKRMGTPVRAKVSGVDLAARCCALSEEKGWRIFFFGAAPGVAEEARARMLARHPGAHIVGIRDGFFKPEDEPAIVAQIREARPDILLVALGIPKQEKFIQRHKAELGVPVCVGVGGTLDVFSGSVRRAPTWMQNSGLEWLYRVASNPKKISKVALLPRFALMTLRAPRNARSG